MYNNEDLWVLGKKVLIVEPLARPDCNSGNYPRYFILRMGKVIDSGKLCACRCGCSNTTSIKNIEYDAEVSVDSETFQHFSSSYSEYVTAVENAKHLLRKASEVVLGISDDYSIENLVIPDFQLDDDF